ncbi:hypothetical protein LCGC14_2059760 [marine sediment metagenome]|uniref:Uncharacterized protein n=1 Tax=marine sediment metagenome TaxID=412755 RepID=A0A0F9HII5_9ZZZZ
MEDKTNKTKEIITLSKELGGGIPTCIECLGDTLVIINISDNENLNYIIEVFCARCLLIQQINLDKLK